MKNTNNMIPIKTIYALTAILGLQFNTMFATGNFGDPPSSLNNTASKTTSSVLAPVIRIEATFEEVSEMNSTILSIAGLTPVISMIVDFSDEAPIQEVSVINLTPITPRDAEFEDETENNGTTSLIDLAPVAPADGDFEAHV